VRADENQFERKDKKKKKDVENKIRTLELHLDHSQRSGKGAIRGGESNREKGMLELGVKN